MTGGIFLPVHGGCMVRILSLLFFIFYSFSGCVWEYPEDTLGNTPLKLPKVQVMLIVSLGNIKGYNTQYLNSVNIAITASFQ